MGCLFKIKILRFIIFIFKIGNPYIFVAQCPEVGTVSQGYSLDEALANLKEATELYLEEFPLPEFERPILTTFEAVLNA